jgi:D-alanyl-D-alanine dipeptidase
LRENKLSKIQYIADSEILAIPIVECHEPMIDLKSQHELVYGPPPENPLTEPDYTQLRETIFTKLCAAQKDLPQGWVFRVYEGFRSLKVQHMLFEEEYARVQARYPDKNHEELFRETTRLISPVKNLDGSTNIPPHHTGAAVDVEIMDLSGKLVDMGMAIADWVCVNPDLCLSDCSFLSPEAQKNRQILLDVMAAHNFVNYPMEWWHFSYGDRYWAYYKKVSQAFYGPVNEVI